MAPFNLENNIREKLENRELKPSSDAWEKLESQLDKKQPKKKIVLWYYAAASIAGILIVSSIFFTQNNIEESTKFVQEQVKENNIEKESDIIPESANEEKIASEDNSEEVKVKKKNTDEEVKPRPPKKESAIDKQIRKNQTVAGISENETKQFSDQEDISKEKNLLMDEKAIEVAASIKALQNNNSEVTSEEVEALLNNARLDIQTKRILQTPKVDAMALLQEAEWELDKSFRDKVFDALGEGFQKLRTAISQRND